MLPSFVKLQVQNNFLQRCVFSQTKRTYSKKDTPDKIVPNKKDSKPIVSKTLKKGLASIRESLVVKDVDDILAEWMDRPQTLPKICDVVIIGGGVMGSSIAYWLKNRVFQIISKL